MSCERYKQQSTQEDLTFSGSSSALSGLSCFVGFVECLSNFVLRHGCFVVVSKGAYRAISKVFCSDCVNVFGVSPLGVDLSLKDEASKLGFVRCVPLNSTLFDSLPCWMDCCMIVEPVWFW